MEMLLVERIIQTLVPPVCCHQSGRVHPLPYGVLFVCSGWLNTCFPNPHEYAYKSAEPTGCDCVEKADLNPLSSSDPSTDHRAFSQACFCEVFLSPGRQKEAQ